MLEGLVEDLEDEKRDFRARNDIKHLKSTKILESSFKRGSFFPKM